MNASALFLGVSRNEALFEVEGRGVLVDTHTHATHQVELSDVLMTRLWIAPASGARWDTWSEIADYSIDPISEDVEVVSASSNRTRAHTIPKAVIHEAQLGLDRAHRLGHQTAMSLLTGQLLAAGGQVSYPKLQHVARFLNGNPIADIEPRTALQKTTWSLWGGDPARRWVNSMVSKKTLALTSDGYLIDPEDLGTFDRDDVIIFALTQQGDPFAVEGLLYVNDANDTVNVWDAGHWTDYGDTDQLNEWADRLVELDEETAMNVAASLDEMPGELVHLSTLNPHETALAMMASFHADPLCARITAALAAPDYTPEERSQNAQGQPRDALGRFATVGAKGSMKSGQRGVIRGVNPHNNYLLIEADDGSAYSIPSREFTIGDGPAPQHPVPPQPANGLVPGQTYEKVMDFSGILAEPRALPDSPKAVMDRALPTLTPAELRNIIEDYQQFIKDERAKNAARFERMRASDRMGSTASASVIDPQISTPDTTDVKPIHIAIVDADDTKAVMDLVALSPASSIESSATTFRRVNGQWIQDPKVLQDLKSPTPPPVVVLNDADYQAVLTQVDSSSPPLTAGAQIFIGANHEVWEFLLAAGDNQTGVGAAERLRIYWTTGKGGLKIRWGSGGDWRRCHRYLRKYLGERSKGYCAIRHHEMNGYWPGDQRNLTTRRR